MEIKELQELVAEMFELKKESDRLKDEKTKVEAKIKEIQAKTLEHLEEHGIKNFDAGANIGKVTAAEKRSVKLLDKYAFFNWYKENINENLEEDFSIPSQTITRIYNEQFETAKLEGNVEFISQGIPGLSEPSVYRTIRMNKPKGAK